MSFPRLVNLAATTLLISMLYACASTDGEDDFERGETEAELYESALRYLDANQSIAAIDYLQFLEAQYPFGAYAEQSQLELVYAQYRAFDHEAAMASADRFIRLHPEHPNVDYAYYMRGLISFTRESSFISNFLPVDITMRDPGSARESFSHFSELLLRFPNSTYGPDARKRMTFLRNMLARTEINVANYYFRRGAYLAATNRGKFVVENFQGSPAVPDGLAVMSEGYALLGFDKLHNDTVRILALNYPNHPALDENGKFKHQDIQAGVERSFLNRATLGLIDRPIELGYDSREIYNAEYKAVEEVDSELLSAPRPENPKSR